MNIGNITITIDVVNDAGITPEMVQALEDAAESGFDSWRSTEGEDLAREALRRLWIATTGHAPETDT